MILGDSWLELAMGDGQAQMTMAKTIKIPRRGHWCLVNPDFQSQLKPDGPDFLWDDLCSPLLSDTGVFGFSWFNLFFNPTTPKKMKVRRI
jgi:hypothetical protein